MIVDAHCHAWARWPYDSKHPDPNRGNIDALLYIMDTHAIDRAVLVAAGLGRDDPRTDNTHNNVYVAAAVNDHPERFAFFADVDSFWSPEHHHRVGAVDRLEAVVDELAPVGFTHYVQGEDDGWLLSANGLAFFERAGELGLIASLHLPPGWHQSLAELAAIVAGLPILLHHQGLVPSGHRSDAGQQERLLALAALPNVFLKISGFHYLTDRSWDYPFDQAGPLLTRLAVAFGPERLVWGSDFPVCTQHVSLRQAIEVVHERLRFLSEREIGLVMGGTLQRLIDARARS
ncbi:amidohydrolase family protein [Kribbella sp. CA-245084]|uniref:amidohydrolase family protein n=1 Tax=Kribbella sp. CA-245084 TaxID=3239940 RepID=UPI003D8BCEAF